MCLLPKFHLSCPIFAAPSVRLVVLPRPIEPQLLCFALYSLSVSSLSIPTLSLSQVYPFLPHLRVPLCSSSCFTQLSSPSAILLRSLPSSSSLFSLPYLLSGFPFLSLLPVPPSSTSMFPFLFYPVPFTLNSSVSLFTRFQSLVSPSLLTQWFLSPVSSLSHILVSLC